VIRLEIEEKQTTPGFMGTVVTRRLKNPTAGFMGTVATGRLDVPEDAGRSSVTGAGSGRASGRVSGRVSGRSSGRVSGRSRLLREYLGGVGFYSVLKIFLLLFSIIIIILRRFCIAGGGLENYYKLGFQVQKY
jgi:hypothetical protein